MCQALTFNRRKNLLHLTARILFLAYRKTAETEKIIKALETDESETNFERIRCPFCRWSPNKSSRWFCADCDAPEYFYAGCYSSWNTFETRGKCPTCAHQWRWTSCLRCAEWSRHEDWYETERRD